MNKLRAFFAVALAVFVAAPAFAETQNVKVSGSLDAYAFYRNNFDLRKGNDAGSVAATITVPGAVHSTTDLTTQQSESDTFFMSITQLQVAAELTDNVSTVINLVNQRDWNANEFATAQATSAAAHEFDVLLDLAYVQMKEIFYSPLTLTIGRQDIVFGRGFVIGWNPQDPNNNIQAEEFTQLQAFDAVRGTLDFNPWTIDLVYVKRTEGSLNPEDDRDLYLANVNYKFAEYNAVAEAYYFGDVDRNTFSGSSGSKGAATHTVGGRVQFDPISQITLGGELAYQFGEYRVSATTILERDRAAWALDLFGEYRWDNTWKPMLGLEYVYLSGEENLSSTSTADYGAWNGSFRLPVYGWIRDYQGTYTAMASTSAQVAGQNQQHVALYGSLKPLEDLQISAQFYHFWTAETAHSTITNPNSASLSEDIGNEIDILVTYNYTADVTFNTYADWFIPGDYFASPNDATATQLIQEVKVTF